jgi:recombination protein RecT
MSTAIVEKPQTELAKKPQTIQEMLRLDGVKHQIAQALPKHCTADRFLRVVANSVRRVPKLAECDQTSFFNALLTLSQYGLEPDGRNAHLIPFRNNKLNITECQLIIDYKGLVELAMRSGLVSTIHADTVCENDEFEYDRGEITKHRIDLRKDRGECYAVYALVKFKDGATKCEVMTRQDIEAIRKRSRAGNSGPWCTDWNEMAKKTVFRRLSKWISISAEFRDAVDADDDTIDLSRTADLVDDRPKADRLADKLIGTKPDAIELNAQNEAYSSIERRIMNKPNSAQGAALKEEIIAAVNGGELTQDQADELTETLAKEMA